MFKLIFSIVKIIVFACLFCVTAWYWLTPSTIPLAASRKDVADAAINRMTEDIRANRGAAKSAVLLHFDNDPTNYVSDSLRHQILSTGILDLEEVPLIDRIRADGRVLPGDIIKVDGFLNHRIDTALMRHIAKEFKKHFDLTGLTAVLTAEASGIALATICAEEFGVPLVFAKKAKSDNIEGGLYTSDIYSYTYTDFGPYVNTCANTRSCGAFLHRDSV